MNDSNNHYMKLISPSNNKTLVTLEKSQNYDPERYKGSEDTWRSEQRRDRETGRRPEEKKEKGMKKEKEE